MSINGMSINQKIKSVKYSEILRSRLSPRKNTRFYSCWCNSRLQDKDKVPGPHSTPKEAMKTFTVKHLCL